MDAKTFAQGYPYTLATAEIYPPGQTPLLTDALDWSYRFGRLLHARLSDTPPDTLTTQREFGQYTTWAKNFPELEDELLANPETGLRDRMEVNFHAMNRHMLDLWAPISRGGWPSPKTPWR